MLNSADRRGLSIIASDKGPGIPDIRQALRDGFSTSGSLGMGLPGVRRIMDEFEINSQPGQGTVVAVKKWQQ
jgi:serine/threonine-protein kinase RsbT